MSTQSSVIAQTTPSVKLSKQQININRLLERTGGYYSEYNGLKIVMYGYEKAGVEWGVLAQWKGRQSRPFSHYKYRTIEKLYAALEIAKVDHDESIASAVKWKEEKKVALELFKAKIEVGTILCSSWGYDQTNVDFYQVIKKSGSTVVFRKIAQDATREQWDSGRTVALKDNFIGGEITRRISRSMSGDYSSERLRIWDGKPKYWSDGR